MDGISLEWQTRVESWALARFTVCYLPRGGSSLTSIISACIWERDMEEPKFLEGPVMISRSPTVHPGDVQMVSFSAPPVILAKLTTLRNEVFAIGRPPDDSIFELNPLPNIVVFPCEGQCYHTYAG